MLWKGISIIPWCPSVISCLFPSHLTHLVQSHLKKVTLILEKTQGFEGEANTGCAEEWYAMGLIWNKLMLGCTFSHFLSLSHTHTHTHTHRHTPTLSPLFQLHSGGPQRGLTQASIIPAIKGHLKVISLSSLFSITSCAALSLGIEMGLESECTEKGMELGEMRPIKFAHINADCSFFLTGHSYTKNTTCDKHMCRCFTVTLRLRI